MAVPTPHRFSIDDYHRMAETGVIPPEARVELLEGQIFDMRPIGPPHGGTVNRLTRILIEVSKGRFLVAVQNPLQLGPHSEPQPDLLLLKSAADDYMSRHPVPEDVFLLIEVADNTIDYDRSVKLPSYGRSGVPEVWIINLPGRTLEVYRSPHFTGYSEKSILHPKDQVRLESFPDVVLNVGSILPSAE